MCRIWRSYAIPNFFFFLGGGRGKLSNRRKTVLSYKPFKNYVLLRTLLNKILNDFAIFGRDTNKLLSQIIALVFVKLMHNYFLAEKCKNIAKWENNEWYIKMLQRWGISKCHLTSNYIFHLIRHLNIAVWKMLCKSIGNHTLDAIFSSVSSLSLSVGIAYRQNFRFEWKKSILKVDMPISTCIFFTFNWLTLTSEMHFAKFHPEVASCLLSRGKRKYAPLGMRLIWKYIRNYFLVYQLISHFLSYLQNCKEFKAKILDLQLEKYGLSFDIKKCITSGWALGDENVIGIRAFNIWKNFKLEKWKPHF